MQFICVFYIAVAPLPCLWCIGRPPPEMLFRQLGMLGLFGAGLFVLSCDILPGSLSMPHHPLSGTYILR